MDSGNRESYQLTQNLTVIMAETYVICQDISVLLKINTSKFKPFFQFWKISQMSQQIRKSTNRSITTTFSFPDAWKILNWRFTSAKKWD